MGTSWCDPLSCTFGVKGRAARRATDPVHHLHVTSAAVVAVLAGDPQRSAGAGPAPGEPIRRTSFSAKVWRPAATAAGLPSGESFHSLRHFYSSLLIRHGESVKTVQARLGHTTAAQTLDTFSHLWPDSEDRTREAIDAAMLGAVVPLVCPEVDAR